MRRGGGVRIGAMKQVEIPHDVLTPLIGRPTELGDAGLGLIDTPRSEEVTGATLPESTVRVDELTSPASASLLRCLSMKRGWLSSLDLA